jgi:aryl-alcohol dehydrogenase-like predicted oxidoreductase
LATTDNLRQFAESRGHSLLDLAFSWLISRPVVASVIAGAKSPEQAQSNAKAANWTLTEAELSDVDRIVGQQGHNL